MRDKYGRNINYLRISVTDRCNLRCIYCMPKQGIKSMRSIDTLRFEDILKIVRVAAKLGIKKIRFTGGEPLVMKDIERLIYETSRIPGIEDIGITTNGILLSDMAEELKKAGLRRVNISLDTLNKECFKSITRTGNLDKVLEGIDKCIKIGIAPIKLNTVMMKGINDKEFKDLINLTKTMPIDIRFIELMPIGEGTKLYERSRISCIEMLNMYPELIPIETEKSSTAKLYKLPGASGRVGFISPLSCKFCLDCNRLRLTSYGTLKPCLHSKEEINLKEILEDEALLTDAIKAAIYNKPFEHHIVEENVSRSDKMMYQIGG
ncbi:MAG TPA: GTP 3',8-cyclase MoaA [Clostridiaceae bacterium]